MPLTNKLTDREVAAFVKTASGRKLFDGGGLYLTVTPAGSAVWRIKYRLGSEKVFTVGHYPDVSLAAARIARAEVREQLRRGQDPVIARRVAKAVQVAAGAVTFGVVARDWLEKQQAGWSATHYQKTTQAMERDILPVLGLLPVSEITPVMVAAAAERIVRRGARETAAKALWSCRGIFELAQARGLCRDNPAIPARAILPRKPQERPMPALTDWPSLGAVLVSAQRANLTRVVYMAHRLLAFAAARIGNVVEAEWSQFDLDAAVPLWTIPRANMKVDRRHFDHRIVLPAPVVEELRAWRRLVPDGYLFPSSSKQPYISRESIEKAYRVTLGLANKHTPHGWRASFSTLAKDAGFEPVAVDLALDHVHDSSVARAYDRGDRLQLRIALAQWWGEQLTQAEAAHGRGR
jgi:integrase